jgi:hypothetical protein
MRIWRAVKASGAAVLRDGVYLLPEQKSCCLSFDAIAADVSSGGGSTNLMRVEALDGCEFPPLFNRQEAYASLLVEVGKVENDLSLTNDAHNALKQLKKLRKSFAAIAAIDFFPGEALKQAETSLLDMELRANRILAPDEPHAVDAEIPSLFASHYQGRLWATRKRPWVDRLASAWIIRRFIDVNADFIWLESSFDCPSDAIGFDFDGAVFTHIGNKVTFEVLLASFSLEQPALKRIGSLVHFLDVGGIQPAEAMGVETVLSGLRSTIKDDDQLLTAASVVFDSLLEAFANGVDSE